MTVRTSAGSTLGISAGIPATFNVAGYGALTFSTVGEIVDLGEFGREFNLVTHNPVGDRGTVKLKGSFNEGQMALELGLDSSDDGQTLMKTARDEDENYSFVVTTQNGDKYYFQAQVMTFKIMVGTVDDVTSASSTLELTTSAGGIGVIEDLASV